MEWAGICSFRMGIVFEKNRLAPYADDEAKYTKVPLNKLIGRYPTMNSIDYGLNDTAHEIYT